MKRTVIANVVVAPLWPLWLLVACGGASREPASGLAAPPSLAPASTPSVAAASGPTQRGIEAGDVNRAVDPCVDFYEFATGTWRAQNPIPEGKPRWGRRAVQRVAIAKKVTALIQEVATRADWPAGSAEQLVGDHYASCMDEAAVEAAGRSPLAPLWAELDAVKTRADVQRAIRRLHELGIAAPFGTSAAFDQREPMLFQLNVVGGGLGLPDRAMYAKSDAASVTLREQYRGHVARMLGLGGVPAKAAQQAAADVLALETRLAAVSLDAAVASDPAATVNRKTFAELSALAPAVDWGAYFDEAKLPRDPVNLAEPKLLQQVDKELRTTPVAVWKAYLQWHLLATAAPWLSRAFSDEAFAFHGKVLGGASEPAPRAQRCAQATEALYGEPLGKLFVERYFPAAAKAKAREISDSLLAVLAENVAGLSWMAPQTKQVALEKIRSMSVQLGYPERWKDTAGLAIRRDALWSNLAAVRKYNVQDLRRQVGKPTDRQQWGLPPFSSAAYLEAQLNELVLPAGFLQLPYFDVGATDAMNYGALGAGLAHDMTHAYDATGAVLDAQGRAQTWWTDADRKAFDQRAQCVIEQYDGYAIEPGVFHQGKQVLAEALADHAGLTFAFTALERSMAKRPVPTVDGFTPQQQFFLAWAQYRGEEVRLEAQRQLIKSGPHPMPKFRVNGPLSDMPQFAAAFSCKPGAPMVRPPQKRCAVW